jgi:hypothetical protein
MNKPRLIDANVVLEILKLQQTEPDGISWAIREITALPTAYDIDKVVEQLEEERDRPFADCDLTINGRPANDREITACKVGINYAIEIVRNGGRND